MCRPKFNRIVGDKRYSVTNLFVNDCKANVGQYTKTGKLHIVEDNINITESDNLVDFTIEDNCYVNDRFIGTTVAKKITANILNPNNEIILENKEIQVFAGMIINEIEESVPFGNFIIEKPNNEEVKENTSFTGYDYMIKFNIPYKNRVTFPCKAKVLFQDICSQAGLVAGNIDFVNCDYLILGNPFTNNEDCRTVLSNIAQLAGGFAKIGRDNKVYIKTLKNISDLLKVKDVHMMTVQELNLIPVKRLTGIKENTDESLDGNNYFDDFVKNNMWGELNSLVLGLSSIDGENTPLDDEDSIRKNGLTEIQINDNYFLIDQSEREKVIKPLWNSLKGIKYLPFKTEYYGYPYLDSGDIIYIQDSKDKGYVSYIFNHTFTFDGGYSGKIETEALTKTQTAYKNNDSTKIKFRDVQRKIDKINGVIEDVIEEQTEHENKISQMLQTIDSFTQKVENEIDVTREVAGIKEIELKNCILGQVLEFEVYGNNSVFDYLLPNDDLLPSDDLLPYGDSKIEIIRQVKDEEGNISEESEIIDLGITERLRQKEDVKDCYRLKDNKAQVIRKIGVFEDGTTYVLPKEKIEELGELKITLNEGTNKIRIVNYTANLKVRYVIKNEFSSTFASYVQVSSLIRQTTQEILMQLSQKVGDEEIIAKFNMAIKDGKSIVELIGDIVKIKSKYFELTADGQITALKGIIAGLILSTNNNGDSWLYKNYKIGNKDYQSGLFIPNQTNGNSTFLYAGCQSGKNTAYSNVFLQHNGNLYFRSGYLAMIYEPTQDNNGNYTWYNAMVFNDNGIWRYLSNGYQWMYDGISYLNGGEYGHLIALHSCQAYEIRDAVHNQPLIKATRLNDAATVPSSIWLYGDVYIDQNREGTGYRVLTSGNWASITGLSDKKYKTNIKKTKIEALPLINKIQHKSFKWKKDAKKAYNKQGDVENGYIANELEEIFKDWVNVNSDNTRSINVLNMLATATKAIQELSNKNNILEKKIKKLEKNLKEVNKNGRR